MSFGIPPFLSPPAVPYESQLAKSQFTIGGMQAQSSQSCILGDFGCRTYGMYIWATVAFSIGDCVLSDMGRGWRGKTYLGGFQGQFTPGDSTCRQVSCLSIEASWTYPLQTSNFCQCKRIRCLAPQRTSHGWTRPCCLNITHSQAARWKLSFIYTKSQCNSSKDTIEKFKEACYNASKDDGPIITKHLALGLQDKAAIIALKEKELSPSCLAFLKAAVTAVPALLLGFILQEGDKLVGCLCLKPTLDVAGAWLFLVNQGSNQTLLCQLDKESYNHCKAKSVNRQHIFIQTYLLPRANLSKCEHPNCELRILFVLFNLIWSAGFCGLCIATFY